MKLKDFIKKYNKEEDKDEFIKSHVKNEYVNYETKLSLCGNILNQVSYVEVSGEKILKRDSAGENLLYKLTLVDRYTDIDVDFAYCLEQYNELMKNDLLNRIIDQISYNELKEFNSVFDMVKNDFYENSMSLYSLISVKSKSLEIAFKNIFDSFEETMNALKTNGETDEDVDKQDYKEV